jgi:hypothetical protein
MPRVYFFDIIPLEGLKSFLCSRTKTLKRDDTAVVT